MRVACWLPLVSILLFGCSRAPRADGPATVPVKGILIDKAGKPLSGGAVEFKNLEKEDIRSWGAVGTDGAFRLHTVVGSEKVDGAPEGKCQVTYYPESQDQTVLPRVLKKSYTVTPMADLRLELD